MRDRRIGSIMVLYATAIHVVWMIALASDSRSMWTTALYTLVTWLGGPEKAAAALFLAALLAAVGLFRCRNRVLTVALLIPQQVFLYASALGAGTAMYYGMFADGVERAHWFIIADQSHTILMALAYTAAILSVARAR